MQNLKKGLIVVLAIGFTIATGCGKEKVAIAPEDFIGTMEGMGAEITDATESMNGIANTTSAQIADVDGQYQIEYYVFEEEMDAAYVFGATKEQLETAAEAASGVTKTSTSVGNHAKYTLSMEGNYIAMSRIGNRVMYVKTTKENKAEVKDIMEQMGY